MQNSVGKFSIIEFKMENKKTVEQVAVELNITLISFAKGIQDVEGRQATEDELDAIIFGYGCALTDNGYSQEFIYKLVDVVKG